MKPDLKHARELVEAYSTATGLGCAITKIPTHEVVCSSGYTCAACALCQALGIDALSCNHEHEYGLYEARRFGGRYIYFCHRGLTFFVSPITGDYESEARFTVGPFLMVSAEDFSTCELNGDLSRMPLVMEIPFVEPEKVTKYSQLLFMAAGFISNVAAAEAMLEQEAIDALQGQVNAYMLEAKRSVPAARYPYEKERAMLQAMNSNDRAEANRLLNELLAHILLIDAASLDRVKARVHELLVIISRSAAENDANDPAQEELRFAGYRQLDAISTMPELCHWLADTMNRLMDTLFAFRNLQHADAISRCVQYIQAHLSEPLELEDLAARAYLSPDYFGRVFKRETGLSLRSYVLEQRLKKSAELIRFKNLKIADVAQLTGFQDQSYFTRAFHKKFGISPNEYRRKFRI